jgi:hypothetical protein
MIPKIHVGQNWSTGTGGSNNLIELSKKLAFVNNNYRTQLAGLALTADWSALSRWHLNHTTDIMTQIHTIKKQTAAAKGVTGNESSLSVKRGADDEASRDMREGSPTKKQRGGDVPSTPTPKSSSLPSTTPKASPPASQTASLFGNAINKGPILSSSSVEKESVSLSASGFQSPFGNSNAADSSKKSTTQSSFQIPKSAAGSKSGFQIPNFGTSTTSSSSNSGNFMAQFGSTSKSAEQMRAERKAKDKLDDYDSDEETAEEWSARWEKNEAERVAKEKEKLKGTVTPALKVTAPSKMTTDDTSTSSLFKTVSGTPSPGLFGSRSGSPAPSIGGSNSVFDTPGATTPTQNNIFGHLSSAPSSNNQEDDEDDDQDQDADDNHVQNEGPQPASRNTQLSDTAESSKRKYDQSASDSDETLEQSMRRKKTPLLSRMTKADPSEIESLDSEKENSKPKASISGFETTSALQTPVPKKSFFFDFAAAGSKTAPPKQDSSAGDQTFKAGTPIKFGTAAKGAPLFQFQPATPSAAELSTTPSKPPPSTFAFLNASNNQPGTGSALSSRAPTPMSEAESGKDSAAETENDDFPKSEQLNLSALTAEEKAKNDILFSTETGIAKQQVEKNGRKDWEGLGRGQLWILKNKETARAIVRMRGSSGNILLNYNILPKLKTTLAGNSRKMVSAIGTKDGGKVGHFVFCFKTPEEADSFSRTYNENAS